jgi:hypothetical protein
MTRQKDTTPVECKLCIAVVPASGMPSHLFHKHNKLSSEQYVDQFGEFRQKYLVSNLKKEGSEVHCEICNEKMISHKQLLHHLHTHKINWQDYYVKHYFEGVHPTCSCGCGAKVKLLRHGKNEKGQITYSREMLPGHCNHKPGYRHNTPEQKETMRLAAIKRLEEGNLLFNSGPSKPEEELVSFIKQQGITGIIQSDKEVLAGLELDIYIPELNLAIEFNGNRFHSDLYKKKNYHLKKTLECNVKGIRLIHVWECDYTKKKPIILSNIQTILGKTPTRIYARECTIKTVTSMETQHFLNQNHLQGNTVAGIRLGLYYKDTLVSMMTFSKLRKAVSMSHKEGSYELARFCNQLNTIVVGGASKLFQHFIKNHNPKHILSFANRDWSMGNMYSKLGMADSGVTPPGYFYTKSQYRYSRFAFTKHKLIEMGFDSNKTEYDIMTEQGYFRIWDCGNLKYEWTSE